MFSLKESTLEFFKYSWTPTLVLLGTILNFLTVLVFCRRRMRKYCLSLSMVCLALSDTTVLIIPVLITWIDEVFFKFYFVNNTIWCNLHGYTDLVFCANSSWIIILISTERYFAVCKPWKKSRVFTNKRVAITLCFIYFISFIVFLYFPLSLRIGESKNSDSTITKECIIYFEKVYNIFGIISVLIVYVLPLFILAFLNIRIIMRLRLRPFTVKLVNSQKLVEMSRLKSHSSEVESAHPITKQSISVQLSQSNYSKNDRNLSITLVTVAVTFMILTFPFQAYWFFENFFKSIWASRNRNEKSMDNMFTLNHTYSLSEYNYDESTSTHESNINIREITFAIKNLNYLINFFLYSALSKLFRQEFLGLITRNNTSSLIPSDRLLTSSTVATEKKCTSSSLTRVSFSMKALKDLPNRNKKKCYLQIKIEPSNFFNYFRKKELRRGKNVIIKDDKTTNNHASGEQNSSVFHDNGKNSSAIASESNIIRPVRTTVRNYRERPSSSSLFKNVST